jgi:ABC-2 type transport system permease protein
VAALILVKPATRSAYVVSHALTQVVFVALASFAGALITWAVTLAVFGEAPIGPVLGATGVWVVLAAVLIGASLLASAAVDAMAGAAGIGIGVYFLLAILGAVPWLARYTPFGLTSLPNAIIGGAQAGDATLWWPVGSGLALAAGLVWGAVAVFRRKELS